MTSRRPADELSQTDAVATKRSPFFRNDNVLPIMLILALPALVVRLAALVLQGPTVLDGDAANYSRIAQNIHDGIGNITIRGVPNTLHAPLYPILTAALLFIIRSPETAGIIVSMVSGIALVVLVYRFTSVLAGSAAGLVAGVLAVSYPALVAASIVPLSESLFMALMFAGLDTLIRALRRPSYRQFAVVGFIFGCAYVTREEAVAFIAIGAIALLVVAVYSHMSLRIIATSLAALLVPFAICATPYIAFLAHATGHIGLEAKSVSNYGIAIQIAHGTSYNAAADSIGPHLEDVGMEVGPSYPFSQAHISTPSPYDRVRLALQIAPHHVVDLYHALGSKRDGMVLFLLFALLGAASRYSSRSGYDLIIAGFLSTEFAALLTIDWFWSRYADTFAALLLPWTACGIVLVWKWMQRLKLQFSLPRPLMMVLGTLLVIIVGPVWFMTTIIDLRGNATNPALFRDAGTWIAHHAPAGSIVMADDWVTAYYAGGTARSLPYTDSSTAIRYIVSRSPCFVVVSTIFTDRPYLPVWAKDGIPDTKAKRVFTEQKGDNRITVYRFDKRDRGLPDLRMFVR